MREYLGSLSLLENDITGPSCGLKKVIPAGRLLDFALLHYYYSINPLLLHTDHPLFTVHEHVQAGLIQTMGPLAYAGYYNNLPCWAPVVEKQRAIMNINATLTADSVSVLEFQNRLAIIKNGVRHNVPSEDILVKHGYEKLPRHSMKHGMFDELPLGEDLQ